MSYKHFSKTLVFFLALLGPLSLWAQDSTYPRIYVIPSQTVGDTSNIAESFSSAVVSSVADNPLVVISPLASAKGDSNTAALAAKLKEGKKLVDSSPEKAVDIFKTTADGYEAIMASEEDFMNYLAALIGLATAYFNAGYEDEFVDAVKTIAVLYPDELPPGVADDVAEEMKKVQEKVRKGPSGNLYITLPEPGAQIILDGTVLPDDQNSAQVPAGKHIVVVKAAGKKPFFQKLTLAAGASTTVTVVYPTDEAGAPQSLERGTDVPKELIAALKKGTINPDLRKQLVALGNKNKAQVVVFTLLARDGAGYKAYSYALQTKDAGLVELPSPVVTPGPAATLAAPATELMQGLVKISYAFPKDKLLAAATPITITPKASAPLAVAVVPTPTEETPEEQPENKTPKAEVVPPKKPGKVNPLDVKIAALPTETSDESLEAPPDASEEVETAPVKPKKKKKDPAVVEGDSAPQAAPKAAAKPKKKPKPLEVEEPAEEKPPREPITFDALKKQKWFWPTVGVLGASAVGASSYALFRTRGLDGTITWQP